MRTTAMSGSRRTTLVAGVASAGALLLQPSLLGGFRIQPTPDMDSTVVLQGPVVDALALLLAVVAAVVLARGVRGEPGLLRASRVAGIAVLVHAASVVAAAVVSELISSVVDVSSSDGAVAPPGVVALSQGVDAIRVLALVLLAVVVARGRLLEPLARVSLLVLGVAVGLSWLLGTVAGGILPAADGISPLLLLLLALQPVVLPASAAVALGLLVHGRSAAMRERADAVRRAW
ncbi:hypothetical protein [Clavibacter zhangzhiyongii]|uniref:hypothetical protein n=1 Tax=Clavibacter zhangzhiyongii TaxID=2768071 RepID=UPI0039E13581